MIWLHTYGVGKFGKRIIKTIHESAESAEDSRKVLGGTVEQFMSAEEVAIEKYHIANAVSQEVSDIIDDFSKHDPAFYGSPGWDSKKLKACNMMSQIIEEGDF